MACWCCEPGQKLDSLNSDFNVDPLKRMKFDEFLQDWGSHKPHTSVGIKVEKENMTADDKVRKLGEILQHPECRLEELWLEGVQEKVMKVVIEALATPACPIDHICVIDCKIGDDGLEKLAKVLHSPHCTLTSLTIIFNEGFIDFVEEANSLAHALRTNPNTEFQRLYLAGCSIGDEGAKCLADAFAHSNTKMQSLELEDCEIGDEGAKSLADVLSSPNTRLNWLCLWGNRIGNEGMKNLAIAIQSRHCKLRTLELNFQRGDKISEEAQIAILNALDINYQSQLEVLEFDWSSEVFEIRARNLMERNARLRKNNQHSYPYTDIMQYLELMKLDEFLEDCESHASVCIVGEEKNIRADDEKVKKLGELLQHHPLGAWGLVDLGLDFVEKNVVKVVTEALATPLCSIDSLSFRDCEMGDDGVENLAKALQSSHCVLTSLSIFYIEGFRGFIEEANSLAHALTNPNTQLEHLHLAGCSIGDAGAKSLAYALSNPSTRLNSLQLEGCDIVVEGAKSLADALKSPNTKLNMLSLCGNRIGNEGIKFLATAIQSQDCKLTNLILGYQGGDRISEAAQLEILNALDINYQSQLVFLTFDWSSEVFEIRARNLIKRNAKLRKAGLAEASLGKAWSRL